ncbi:HotDog domain-containing protein [Fimicolochytrium jonesii]|uniref:HotDog domain-containing protein n=1 Tax=Fimicolochytrium jonesii TaxID=1396493 RepID=UPI0022FED0CE|nr:HotDog domain-containing protein [Fimicolochytrium jonesii]KAI8820476.1 HotDog domain-containing protein [Fimicolochytrium jonesii]
MLHKTATRRLALIASQVRHSRTQDVRVKGEAFIQHANFSSGTQADAKAAAKALEEARKAPSYYRFWEDITTRWKDNDQYGHINNVEYYSFFDTIVNNYLIRNCGLDPSSIRKAPSEKAESSSNSKPIYYVVSSGCRYHASASYPNRLQAGLAVNKIGRSSVVYHVAVYKKGEEGASHANNSGSNDEGNLTCLVTGEFVHVCVDPASGRPVDVPDSMRRKLELVLAKKE